MTTNKHKAIDLQVGNLLDALVVVRNASFQFIAHTLNSENSVSYDA